MTGRGGRRRHIARGAVFATIALVAVVGERELAPRAWDIFTYAQSYAAGHVAAGYWDEGQARWFVVTTTLHTLLPLIALALCPLLVGWWLGRHQ